MNVTLVRPWVSLERPRGIAAERKRRLLLFVEGFVAATSFEGARTGFTFILQNGQCGSWLLRTTGAYYVELTGGPLGGLSSPALALGLSVVHLQFFHDLLANAHGASRELLEAEVVARDIRVDLKQGWSRTAI